MTPERNKWLMAMRSGKYSQTSAKLYRDDLPTRDDDWGAFEGIVGFSTDDAVETEVYRLRPGYTPGHCCLGVAVAVFDPDLPIACSRLGDNNSVLSNEGKETLQLADRDMLVLTTLNDKGVPFGLIADLVEEQCLTGLPIEMLYDGYLDIDDRQWPMGGDAA